jgi:hypothetical protein
MGRKTTKRAVLLNKDGSSCINKVDFSAFLKEFLKTSKKERASPPTRFEKELIARPLKTIESKKPKKDKKEKK